MGLVYRFIHSNDNHEQAMALQRQAKDKTQVVREVTTLVIIKSSF